MAEVSELGQLIHSRMQELGLSYRRAAQASGGRVSHATLHTLVTGKHRWAPDDSTLAGIALALDVPLEEVRRAVGRVEPVAFTLPSRSSQLSPQGRRMIVVLADVLLAVEDAAREGWSDRLADALTLATTMARRA